MLYQDKAVPSSLLWHKCGKLKNLKLEGNETMKLRVPGCLESSLMIHFGFRVLDVNWLVGALRKGIQS